MRWRRKEAKMLNREPVIIRKLILHLGGGCDWDIPALAQRDQILAKFRSSTLPSDKQNRPLRLAEQGGGLLYGGSTGLGSRDAMNPGGEQTSFHPENVCTDSNSISLTLVANFDSSGIRKNYERPVCCKSFRSTFPGSGRVRLAARVRGASAAGFDTRPTARSRTRPGHRVSGRLSRTRAASAR